MSYSYADSWKDGKVVMVDQSKLPGELVFVEYDRYRASSRLWR